MELPRPNEVQRRPRDPQPPLPFNNPFGDFIKGFESTLGVLAALAVAGCLILAYCCGGFKIN